MQTNNSTYQLQYSKRNASHVTKIYRRVDSGANRDAASHSNLRQSLEEINAEIEAMQHSGLLRPKRAVGLTNQEVMAVAKHEGLSPYRYDWWDGLDPVVIREAKSGCFRRGVTHTLTELKAKQTRLKREIAWMGREI